MTTPLTLRSVKGSPLTSTEGDNNLLALRTTADAAQTAMAAAAFQALLVGDTGAAQIGYLAPYMGAVARTQAAKNAETVTLSDFAGCDITGLTSSDAAFAAAIASFDKDIGGTLHVSPGYYRLGAQTIDGYNNLRIKGDEGAYILSTTTGDLFTLLDCRRFTYDGVQIFGRANSTATQDNMPAFTGIVDPARVFYIHERQATTRSSQFINIKKTCYYGQSGTTLFAQVGNPAIGAIYHQPSDVYFEDVNVADLDKFLKVAQVNSQAIYVNRCGGSSIGTAFFEVVAGDLWANDIQVSGLDATATMLLVEPAADDDVKRVIIKGYLNENAGGIIRTNTKRIPDRIEIEVVRASTTSITWPYDIQCKDSTVWIHSLDSNYDAALPATSFLRSNQATRLHLSGTVFTLAGSPTCTMAVIDDALAVVDSWSSKTGGGAAVPLTNFIRPNIIPGAGSKGVLRNEEAYGNGFTAFSIASDGTMTLDKKAAGNVLPFTEYFEVTPAEVLTCSYLVSESTIQNLVSVDLFFYDAVGVFISSTNCFLGVGTNAGVWQARAVSATVPALSALCRIRLGTIGGTTLLKFKNLKVERGSFATPFALGEKRDSKIILSADPVSGFWPIASTYYKSAPASAGYVGKVCTVAGYAVKGAWTNGVAYVYGDYTSNAGKVYRCTSVSGNAGATPPTHTSGTASDGTLDWLYIGTSGQPTWKDFGLIA